MATESKSSAKPELSKIQQMAIAIAQHHPNKAIKQHAAMLKIPHDLIKDSGRHYKMAERISQDRDKGKKK